MMKATKASANGAKGQRANKRKAAKSSPAQETTAQTTPDETDQYVLRLYVTGVTPRSTQAIANIKAICEEHLQGRYSLEVVDVYQQPELAQSENIIAMPTLVKQLPSPLRHLVGDLSKRDKVLVGLNLQLKP